MVLIDGEPILYLDRRGRRLRTFEGKDDPELLGLAAAALNVVAARRRGKLLRIEEIDGSPARTSKHASLFRNRGFTADHRGLILEVG